MKKIAIIDYGLGNLFSVQQACLNLGMDAEITSDHSKIKNAHGIILPGVGAFAKAMENFNEKGLTDLVKTEVKKGKPFMGVCLGLQLLANSSEEFATTEGLGLIPGKVVKFPHMTKDNKVIRVPQIGWNKLQNPGVDWERSPLQGISKEDYFYFVHSFYISPDSKDVVLTQTEYEGVTYASSLLKDNIFAVQYHPEKSGEKGLLIYKNWMEKYV